MDGGGVTLALTLAARAFLLLAALLALNPWLAPRVPRWLAD